MGGYGFGGEEEDEYEDDVNSTPKASSDWIKKGSSSKEPRCVKDGLITTNTMSIEELLASCGMKEEF